MTPPNKKKPTDVISRINTATNRAVDSDIDEAFSNLFEGDERHNNQLPEHIFKENFLLYFAGKIKDGPRLGITTAWIGVAGSPMNPVDIVDTSGAVVCTVPPLMTTDFLRPGEKANSASFNEIFKDARIQSTRLPELGGRAIAVNGSAKIESLKAVPETEQTKQWNKIFDRYGIEYPKSKETQLGNKSSHEDDELLYD